MAQIKIHLAQINNSVGDLDGNYQKIIRNFKQAEEKKCDLVVFCEMALTGYPCDDLWNKKSFIEATEAKIEKIRQETNRSTFGSNCAILFGTPIKEKRNLKSSEEVLYNAALIIEKGEIKRKIRKKTLPNYGVFDEQRYFEPYPSLSLVEFKGMTLAIMICEDFWDKKNQFLLKEQVFDAAVVINASPYSATKQQKRQQIVESFSELGKPIIYLNQVGAQDSIVFDGSSFAIDKAGNKKLQMASFKEDFATITLSKGGNIEVIEDSINKTTNNLELIDDKAHQIYSACVLGLREYLQKNSMQKVLLGMSGGIDSALVATMAVDALGSENVALYALPSRYSSLESINDAKTCANNLSVKLEKISIEGGFEAMLFTLKDRLKGESTQLTTENIQSRLRGNILMSLSNLSGALLLSTGNKSELATGYATIYGDMCGAYNPIKDLYKTQIFELAKWRNDNVPNISTFQKKNLIPQNIITKEPSAELRPNQKDSDSLPNYEILDQILFAMIEEEKSAAEIVKMGFDENIVGKIGKLFYRNEYKRKQSAPGPNVSDMAFDKERRYPITNKFIF